MNFLKYFKSVNAQKQIKKLARKYNGKKIVIYGSGQFSRALFSNFDLSGLNIVAVVDRAFEIESNRTFFDLNCIAPKDLREFDFDIILLTVQDALRIKDYLENELLLESKNSKKKIKALIRPKILSIIKEIFD